MLSEMLKGLYNQSSSVAVPYKDRWRSQPVLELVQTQRDILSEISIENPDLTVGSWTRNTVTIVMEENSFVFGVAAHSVAKLLYGLHSGIQTELISGLVKTRE